MEAQTLALRLPGLLQAQVTAAHQVGLYADETDLITDAVRMLLAARPDVRQASACQLYQRGIVSLGKAAELAELDIVSFKRVLAQHSITRSDPETLSETLEMARNAIKMSGRE
jgi:predicted HTH domain antitoxin